MDVEAGKGEAILGTWDDQTVEQDFNVQYIAEPVKIEGE